MQRCFGIHVKTLNNISSAGSNFFFFILNSLCTKNDLIIYEWKWLLVFAIKNLISAILRFGQNIFQSPFHWLLWQCLPAKKVDRTPIKHRADGSGGAEQSHLKIVIRDGEKNIQYFDQKLSPNQHLCLLQPLISHIVQENVLIITTSSFQVKLELAWVMQAKISGASGHIIAAL